MSTVICERNGAVLTVTLNRPEALNAFSNQLMDDLADAFLEATSDNSVKVLILTGGGRAFSAGADLTEMGKGTSPPKHGFAGLLDAIIEFPKPFLVAINGLGVGIGATICGLADMAFIAESGRLRFPFSALGLVPEAASTVTLPLLMGRQRANWALWSSEWLDANACVASGLAMTALPDQELLAHVGERANTLAALPSASLIASKALMMEPIREQLHAAARAENQQLAQLAGGPANREAILAFREKRPPDFRSL